MMYFDEMQSKYGFSDGEAVPAGARMYREVYIQAINTLARKYKSKFRAYAYDRPGLHNPFFIVFKRTRGDRKPLVLTEIGDDPMHRVIEVLQLAELDSLVVTRPRIRADVNTAIPCHIRKAEELLKESMEGPQ